MVKHSQTIRRQLADELFKCVWPFCGIGTQRVSTLVYCSVFDQFWFLSGLIPIQKKPVQI